MPAVDGDEVRRSIARLGDVVIDPTVWPQIMQDICSAIGAEGAMLLQSDVRTPDIPRTASIEDAVRAYFRDEWHKRDLRAERGVPLLLNGEKVIIDQDLITPDQMRWSPYYNDCVRRNGLQWFAAVGFRAGSAFWALAIQRTSQQGPFEAADKDILAQLSPRLTEVATLSATVGRAALLGVVNALNLMSQATVAIDRNGFVIEANAAAEGLFDQEIRVSFRRLVLADMEANRAYEILLARLRLVPDQSVVQAEPIVVRRQGRAPLIIKVLPIDGAARGPFLGARALLLLVELGAKPAPKESLLVKAYGLSRAEARLAARLAMGRSLEEAANELGIALATARTQLKAVFTKTGVHRQGELVALLGGM
jgi:DNA-binding CsgD family transcriptional regulator/PAS domain-containing protein